MRVLCSDTRNPFSIAVAFFVKRSTIAVLLSQQKTAMTFTATLSLPISITGGQDIGIFPVPSELTVAQAAEILDMSEACVEDYLDDGIIESRWEDNERLVQWNSLLKFDQKQKWMEEGLNEIVRLSQEMGLYDD